MKAGARHPDRDRLRRGGHGALPRYASYPAMDRFVEAFASDDHALALRQRRASVTAGAGPLSLYVHIPFCQSLCYFCNCNKTIAPQRQQATAYLRYLEREVDLLTAELGTGQTLSRLHVGGGTPTFLSDEQLGHLMALLRHGFTVTRATDQSIEVDPRTVDGQRLMGLFELGFKRVSFGVQDIEPTVQEAVNRLQSAESVVRLVNEARQIGFTSINLDLIYGLPRQTPDSFDRTMAQMTSLRPDRVSLCAYVQQPERDLPQRRFAQTELPTAPARQAMHSRAVLRLLDAGYCYIGMGEFALAQDALDIARRHGLLQRDFQGYYAGTGADLLGLGVSAAGRMGATYSQNARAMADYCDLLDHGRLPVVRGLALTRDDLVRRAVIMALMCQGEVSFEGIELAYLLDFSSYFASELAALERLGEDGLVTLSQDRIQVTAKGLFVIEAIACVFDRYLQSDRARQRSPQPI